MLSIESMTKQEKKAYFIPYIVANFARGVEPVYREHDTGQSIQRYYILGDLPFDRFAIYELGAINIVKGFSIEGSPIYEGVIYSAQSLRRIFPCASVDLFERDLVLQARQIIAIYKKRTNCERRF